MRKVKWPRDTVWSISAGPADIIQDIPPAASPHACVDTETVGRGRGPGTCVTSIVKIAIGVSTPCGLCKIRLEVTRYTLRNKEIKENQKLGTQQKPHRSAP